jgi:RND family efflux transporter MFP subunit
LLGYAARSTLWPAVDVWVVPVVAKAGGGAPSASASPPGGPNPAPARVLVQAPGWIEADPYAVSVPALVEGVIKEVLVLEGQAVEAGQVVARLVDDDARLAADLAAAGLEERESEVRQVMAALAVAVSHVEEARDEVDRKRKLVAAGGVSEGQFARLQIRLQSLEQEAEAARTAVATAQAAARTHAVMCEQARLALSRTEVRAPSAGVVLARLVEPGSRASMSGKPDAGGMSGTVVRLYDPAKLQVRADVPLADVAKIGVGTPAEITTEALPDQVLHGAVTRVVHEANIQRNTVQVKVAIENTAPTLKPEMLTRVRFHAGNSGTAPGGSAAQPQAADGGLRLFVPIGVLSPMDDSRAQVWLVQQSSSRQRTVVKRHDITIVPGSEAAAGGYAEVSGGLRAGDRLVINAPASLTPNARVRVLGEQPPAAAPQGGKP